MKGGHIAGYALAGGLSFFAAREASAFCGFYVSGADASLFNDATQVALMRDGTRTVLSMQNDYKGPPEDFAIVVPVPVILQKENVKTLSKSVFAHLDKLTAPRLVEYWEQDPCSPPPTLDGLGDTRGGIAFGGAGLGRGLGSDKGVTIEAKFEVGEYEILILSAKDSTGLDAWLRENKYKIPAGAAEVLKPYVEGGSKFFVAKVDATKVKIENGRAALSPLRFSYDSDKLELPVKLGLLNSSGTQDLIIYVLGRERFEVANFPNVTIPTNIDVSEKARAEFGSFYASLYDHTLEKHPSSVVTEYSWQATSCDPCPGDMTGMDGADLTALGGDVLPTIKVLGGGSGSSATLKTGKTTASPGLPPEVITRILRQNYGRFRLCYENGLKTTPDLKGTANIKFDIKPDGSVSATKEEGGDLADKEVVACLTRGVSNLSFPQPENKKTVSVSHTLTFAPAGVVRGVPAQTSAPMIVTRLHARYGKNALGQDLVFRVATPISGGREYRGSGQLEHGASPAEDTSSFQARYAIRHPWTGPIACKEPRRNNWGGPWPDAGAKPETATATNLGLTPHGTTTLSSFTTATDLGATKLDGMSRDDAGTTTTATSASSPSSSSPSSASDAGPTSAKPSPACGCRVVGEPSQRTGFGALVVGVFAFLVRRRRR